MQFPEYRARRLRKNENFRRLIRETKLSVDDLIYPLFAVPGKNFKKPISSMPGQFNYPLIILPKKRKKRVTWEYPLSCFSAFLLKKMRWLRERLPKMA